MKYDEKNEDLNENILALKFALKGDDPNFEESQKGISKEKSLALLDRLKKLGVFVEDSNKSQQRNTLNAQARNEFLQKIDQEIVEKDIINQQFKIQFKEAIKKKDDIIEKLEKELQQKTEIAEIYK